MKKILAVLCGCMMIVLAACGGKNTTTDSTKEATPTATESSEVATATSEPSENRKKAPTSEPTAAPTSAPTSEPTAEPTSEPTSEPTVEPTVEPTAEPTSEPTVEPTAEPTDEPTAEPTAEPAVTIALPTPTQAAEVTPVPDPTCVEDTISAKDFLKMFTELGKERSVSRVSELKAQYDGRTILEDTMLYVVYLDLSTLPEAGFEPCDVWEGWYRWNGIDEEYKLFKGITMVDEEYNAGVLEIEIREAVAYGATPGNNATERSGYWLYFRNDDYVDIYDYTIFSEGIGESVDATGVTTDAKLYYRQFTDRVFDLVFEVERREAASEDGKTYRVSTHTSVLGTMTDMHDAEYYVDTIVKECDNAEDGSKTTETVDFTIVDCERSWRTGKETRLAKGTLAVGASKKIADESELEAAALELVQSTVALSGYTFEQKKDGDVYKVRFGDGIDVIAFEVTIGLTSGDGGQSAVIEAINIGCY